MCSREGIPTNAEPRTITGIVLAGGRSRRFGSDKLVAAYGGRPLLHLPIEVLASICDEVIVAVAPGKAPTVPKIDVPIRVAYDAKEGEGPLAGLLAALRLTWTPLAMVVGGDMPELKDRVLVGMQRVIEGREDLEAVVLSDAKGPSPLPVVLHVAPARREAIKLMKAGSAGLRDLLLELQVAAIDEVDWRAMDPFGGTLHDVDVPGDLR